ncbi:MAG TPA: hypothetical protein VJG83_04165 [archaeon]|nr:hypothetical protein [archaeon]
MGTMTIGVDDEIEEKFRHTVAREIGKGKGSLGRAVGQAMEKWVKEKEHEEIRKRAIKKLEMGYSMGKLLFKNRDELHDR